MFDESDVHDTPTGAANKESQTFFARLKRIGGSKSVKYQPVELNARKSKKQKLSRRSCKKVYCKSTFFRRPSRLQPTFTWIKSCLSFVQ